jgi:hypothetical protein
MRPGIWIEELCLSQWLMWGKNKNSSKNLFLALSQLFALIPEAFAKPNLGLQ